ncbi:MAG: flagellar basal body rod protein FlgB [Candidatus Zixiibacteriota bacterium]
MFERLGVNLVQQSLDAQTKRQKTIAENIANINTPGYTAKRVRFEEILNKKRNRARLNSTSARHIPMSSANVKPEFEDTGKDVDLDTEMGQLAKIQLLYSIETRSISQRFKMLKESISGQIR